MAPTNESPSGHSIRPISFIFFKMKGLYVCVVGDKDIELDILGWKRKNW